MKSGTFSLLVTLFSLVQAKVDPSFNEVIDSIVSARTSEESGLDRIKIADTGFEFERKVSLLKVSGIAKFFNISISGLSEMKRVRDIETEKIDELKSTMTIFLGVPNIHLDMIGVLKFMGFGPERRFEGSVDNFVMEMQLKYSQLDDEVKVSVLKVVEMGKLQLKAAGGFQIVDAVTNQVLKMALSSFDQIIKYAAELAMMKIAEKFMDQGLEIKRVMSMIS